MREESWVEDESESRGMAESDVESSGMGNLLEDEDEEEQEEQEDDEYDEYEDYDDYDDDDGIRTPNRFFTISSASSEADYYFYNAPGLSSHLLQLVKFMDDWSSDPSFDRSRADTLIMKNFTITRPFLTRLLPLLLHHQGSHDDDHDHDHMEPFPGTCTTSSHVPALKFHSVEITNCPFFSPPSPVRLDENDDVCTPDDKNSFLSALAQLPGTLMVDDTHIAEDGGTSEILSGLLNIAEIDRFKVTGLRIMVPNNIFLSDWDYIKLGAMIQGSEQLTHLTLYLPYPPQIPRDFFDHVANSVHLRSLSLLYHQSAGNDEGARYPSLLFAEEGNGMVERLLRNPQSQLIQLVLRADLDDHNLISLAQFLPTSHISTLDLSFHDVGDPGFLEFARQFPNMLSLNFIDLPRCARLRNDTSTRKEYIEECGDFFLQGLMENPSITWFNIYDDFPQRRLMLHYLSLNRAGRKLLVGSSQKQPIPDGLWPLVLERAGASGAGAGDDAGLYCFLHWYHTDYVDDGPVNAVYFFLQNCPKLLFYPTRR